MTPMRPLSRHELQVGSPLAQAVYDREGKLLLEAGHVLRSDAQCESLVARGYVREAETQRRSSSGGLASPPAGLAASGLAASGPRAWPTRVGPGILRLRDELRAVLPRLLQSDPGDAGQRLCELREPLLRYLRQDADAALAYMQLSAREDGQAARPIHAALLIGLMAQTLALDEVELQSLLGAALSFDCALAPLARVLNDQRAELTPAQRELIRTHPERSAQALEATGIADALWLQAVRQHHERLDGSGYPGGERGDAISRGARLLALVDTYCAMIRPRAYRGAIAATEAMRAIFLERGTRVDEHLAALFVREIGIYPPGGLVRLENNEVAVVFRRGASAVKPRVRCLIDRYGKAEVTRPERDTATPGFAIAESLSTERYQGLLPGLEKLWDA